MSRATATQRHSASDEDRRDDRRRRDTDDSVDPAPLRERRGDQGDRSRRDEDANDDGTSRDLPRLRRRGGQDDSPFRARRRLPLGGNGWRDDRGRCRRVRRRGRSGSSTCALEAQRGTEPPREPRADLWRHARGELDLLPCDDGDELRFPAPVDDRLDRARPELPRPPERTRAAPVGEAPRAQLVSVGPGEKPQQLPGRGDSSPGPERQPERQEREDGQGEESGGEGNAADAEREDVLGPPRGRSQRQDRGGGRERRPRRRPIRRARKPERPPEGTGAIPSGGGRPVLHPEANGPRRARRASTREASRGRTRQWTLQSPHARHRSRSRRHPARTDRSLWKACKRARRSGPSGWGPPCVVRPLARPLRGGTPRRDRPSSRRIASGGPSRSRPRRATRRSPRA